MTRAGAISYIGAGPEHANADARGPAVPIICLHGIGGNGHSFEPQLEELKEHTRLIAWNMPGYGGSSPLPETTFSALSAALARFMDDLDIPAAHLIGHSIGGMIALDFALRYPDRAASLALIATTSAFGGRDESFKTAFLRARMEPLEQGRTMPDLAAEFVPEIVGPDTAPDVIAAATASMAAVPPESYRAIMACLITFNRRDGLAALDLPVCLIAGSEDTNAPAKTMAKMARAITGASFDVIEGAGHLVNLEAPKATNDILKSFYDKQTKILPDQEDGP